MRIQHFLVPTLAAALCGSIFAQGQTCSTATPIDTLGQWQWDSGLFNHNAFNGGANCNIGSNYWDAYFQWTAPFSGDFSFSTVGATWDTQLSIYSGVGCLATCLAFHTDPGSFFSTIELSAVQAGETFLIRSATLSDSHPGYGGLTIGALDPNCSLDADSQFEEPGYEDNVLSNGTHTGLKLRAFDLDRFSFCLGAGDTAQVDILFSHAQGNINASLGEFVPNASGIGYTLNWVDSAATTTDNETLMWTNTSGVDRTMWVALNFLSPNSPCVDYDLVLSGSGGCGFTTTTFCDPMDPNSTGLPTLLTASPLPGQQSGLHLESTQGPSGQFGYLHVGTGISDPGLPIGGGRFCLAITGGNLYGRYNIAGTVLNSIGRYDVSGVFQNLVGTSTSGTGFDVPVVVPIPGVVDNHIGSLHSRTWHFQIWHREANGASNLSNGVSVSF